MLREINISGTVKGVLQDNGPGRPATLTLAVKDYVAPATAPAAVGLSAMTIGTTVVAADFPLLTGTGRAAGAKFCRTFSGPGEGILPWSAGRRRLPAGVADFHSFKDWASDAAAVAAINQLLDTMPPALLAPNAPLLPDLEPYDPDGYGTADSDGFSFLLTYCHEGEGNFIDAGLTATEWRRRHRLAYRTVRQHRNGHRVGYMPIQTGTWTEMMSGGGKVKGNRDPLTWWAGVGDYAGWDAYAFAVTDKPTSPRLYPTPAAFLELPALLARATGRRLFLPELGAIRQGGPIPDDGALRSDWIADVVAYLDEIGCAGAAWWDALGANSRDFRLTDAVSAGAWKRAIAGAR